ncbi:MAG TPA: MBL fold metallo-hydrolase [Tepidisphaeraceae bacterium]|jgi:glyoxylase-like metal-dependent hydrolase (beta-lactamase superfamily II)|nr:MBL fold metallo-hydrolase [Tepidisphaeraceae bacterium]
MKIVQNTGGIAQTNSYLIADESTGLAVIFDAPNSTVKPLLDEAKKNGWDVIGLWLTHGHFDHIADHAEVIAAFPQAKVLIHRLDEPMLRRPISSFFSLPFTIQPRAADAFLDDGQELQIGSLRVNVIHTPGHAPGHVMFYFPDKKILIGGDLIIMGAIGRTDLPGSDARQINPSIRRVLQLPLDTTLLPGHGEASTLSDEIAGNPYVRQAMLGR